MSLHSKCLKCEHVCVCSGVYSIPNSSVHCIILINWMNDGQPINSAHLTSWLLVLFISSSESFKIHTHTQRVRHPFWKLIAFIPGIAAKHEMGSSKRYYFVFRLMNLKCAHSTAKKQHKIAISFLSCGGKTKCYSMHKIHETWTIRSSLRTSTSE